MPKTAKPVTYNDNDRAIVNALKGTEGLTLAEINAAAGLEKPLVSGNIVSAMKKGLIVASGEREIERPVIRPVGTYRYVTDEVLMGANGKPFNYTDGEKVILAAAKGIDGEFTLSDLASAMGLEKVHSGSINGLVKKGNIEKAGSRDVESYSKTSVKVYSFVRDIPDAE